MNKQKIISLILITFGSFLEVFYYFNRYYSEGTAAWISAVQGIALTALLMGLFLMRAKWYVWIIIVLLAGYSIFNTAAGQRQALTMKAESEIIGINTQKINDLENSIQRKRDRYQQVETLLNNSIDDFDDMWEWRNTTARYEEELSTLDSEIQVIEKEVIALRNPEIDESETGKLYRFYSDLIGINPEWLQFWLQIIFSAFIAIMAPVGIIIFPAPPRKRSPMKKTDQWRPYVERFVHTNWTGIRQGSHKNILSKDNFIKHLSNKGFEFSSRKYDIIYNAAKKMKVVDNTSITCENERNAIEAIIKVLGR
jgi:hypothetical protein